MPQFPLPQNLENSLSLANTPLEYAKKYKKPKTLAAYELGLDSQILYRYEKGDRNPSATACRVAQLMDFIIQSGLEPPEPIYRE